MVEWAMRINDLRIVGRHLGRGGFGDCSIGSILHGGSVVIKRLRYDYDIERYNRVSFTGTLNHGQGDDRYLNFYPGYFARGSHLGVARSPQYSSPTRSPIV